MCKWDWPQVWAGRCFWRASAVAEVVVNTFSAEFSQSMIFALQAVTKERSASQVDEYLTWSRQTGSTLNVSPPFYKVNRHKHTHTFTRPDTNTPSISEQFSCQHTRSHVHRYVVWNTHTHTSLTFENLNFQDKKEKPELSPDNTICWLTWEKCWPEPKGVADVHSVTHWLHRENLNE